MSFPDQSHSQINSLAWLVTRTNPNSQHIPDGPPRRTDYHATPADWSTD